MKYFFLCCLVLFITGCSSPPKQSGFIYLNDMESIKGWQSVQLARWPVHSGWFSNKIDSLHPYGITFSLPLKEIFKKDLEKVKFSMWTYFPKKSESLMVLEIEDADKKQVYWKGIEMDKQVKQIGRWEQVTAELSLQDSIMNNPDNVIKIYPWANGRKDVYVDDVVIEFVKKRNFKK